MNPERRAAILRLLETRWDGLPEPQRRTLPSSPGFVHADALVTCEDCLANGGILRGCETCGGSGRVIERRDRDPYAEAKTVFAGLDGSRHDVRYARDATIDRLGAQLREPFASFEDELADANLTPEKWQVDRARMYRRYDYAALDVAMTWFQSHNPYAFDTLNMVSLGRAWTPEVEARREKRQPWHRDVPRLDDCLEFLSRRLPDPLRAPETEPPVKLAVGQVKRAGPVALAERDREIVRAVLVQGASSEAVARVWGITARQVNRIVGKEAA